MELVDANTEVSDLKFSGQKEKMASSVRDPFVWLIEIYSFWIADGRGLCPARTAKRSIPGGTFAEEPSDNETGLGQS